MQKRLLAMWLVVCMVLLAVPTEGLSVLARANVPIVSDNSTEEPVRAASESITLDGLTYEINSDGTTLALSSVADKSITAVSIPTTVLDNEIEYTVTEIKYEVFSGCSNLAEVTLPDSLEKLGYHAFKDCVSLTSIEIPNTLTTISGLTNASPFVGCTNLTEITFESGIQKIPAHMFHGFKSLTEIEIPDGVEIIGYQAFAYCAALENVALPGSLEEIHGEAFLDCTSLETIEFPSTLKGIRYSAFSGCKKLTDVTLPKSIEALGSNAFENCVSLTSIEIPNTLTTISGLDSLRSPFAGCSNLREVIFEKGIQKIPAYMFKSFKTLERIVIPDGVEQIGSEAFQYCRSLKEVTLPDGLKEIHSDAFADCETLSELYIPATVNKFYDDIFDGTPNVVVHTGKDTHATVYSIDNGIPFYWVNNTAKNSEEDMLDRNMCQYLTDSQSSANGYLSYRIDYGFKETAQVSGLKISVYIPEHVTLAEDSILVDGILDKDYTISGNVLKIPVSKTSGTITYKVKQQDQKACYSYAKIDYTMKKRSYTEVIGATQAQLLDMSLEMDEETDAAAFRISGVALPGKQVQVYLNDVLSTEVVVSKAGVYQAGVTISSPQNYKTYDVKAVSVDRAGGEISVSKKITFIPGIPKLTSFVMQHNGQRYSLTELEGLKPIVTFRDHCEFSFEASFENDDQIEAVYFVSTRNNIEKKMKAFKDESSGTYKALGFFDPSNQRYVPGTITIEYIRAGKTSYFDGDIDFSTEEYVNSLPEEFAGAEAVDIVKTENEVSAILTFPELDNSQIEFSITTQDIPAELTQENAEQYGYQRIGGAEMASALARDGIAVDRAETPATLFFKEVENEVTGQIEAQLLDFAEGKIKAVSGYGAMIDLYKNYGSVMEWMETGVTYKENRLKIKEAKEAVLTSDWSAQEKAAALDNLETAQILNNKKVALRVAATILAVAGVANPTLSFMIGAMSFLTDYRLEASMLDVNSLVSKVSGSAQINFRWAIDPSGYIYDADTLERIVGATVTLYYKETESSTPVIWDASEYLQLNPLTSAEDGTYAWDVPEGWWQVKAEKEGYVTASSEWLPVPPPQTEVNIALKKIDTGADDGQEDDSDDGDTPGTPSVTPPTTPQSPQPTVTKVSKIKITGISKKIAVGKKVKLTVSVSPSNADNKTVRWKTSNKKYATVSSAGVVTLKKAAAGKTVTIMATAKDGSGVKATYKITGMKHAVKSVKLKASKKTVKAGKSVKIKATVKTTGKKVNKTLKWTSSNTKYATVTSKGVVKAKKAGKGKTVTITATSTDGSGKKAKIKIKIK